jgi:hypothetical protein
MTFSIVSTLRFYFQGLKFSVFFFFPIKFIKSKLIIILIAFHLKELQTKLNEFVLFFFYKYSIANLVLILYLG